MNNLTIDFNKDKCCGCTACFNSCPKNAISMVKDEKGFLYPSIDNSLCINCGICLSVCDFRKNDNSGTLLKTVACKHKDPNERGTSTSGAAFQILVDYICSKGGVAFGCELINPRTIAHTFYDVHEQMNKFKKSKYVQSDLKNTFYECLKFLKQGRFVLFSGTGCQISGLLSYLKFKKADTTRLITCDIICHGCPSPDVWSAFVDELEEREKSPLKEIQFRNKKFGWHSHIETFSFENGKNVDSNKWASMFYSNVLFRESCYNCKYTKLNRNSDFTIADCWGIEKSNQLFDDNKGVSLVLFHTKKSLSLLEHFKYFSECIDIDIKQFMQPQMSHPVEKGKHYNQFWENYSKRKNKTIKTYFFRSSFRLFLQGIKDKVLRIVRK